MAKDPVSGPVTLYDAFGFPIKPEVKVAETNKLTMDLPLMRETVERMKMPALRALATDIGVKAARSREETIERIMVCFEEINAGDVPAGLLDTRQAPPPDIPPVTTSPYEPVYHLPPSEDTGKSVRVRRIEEASGKKAE